MSVDPKFFIKFLICANNKELKSLLVSQYQWEYAMVLSYRQ